VRFNKGQAVGYKFEGGHKRWRVLVKLPAGLVNGGSAINSDGSSTELIFLSSRAS
jgi:hypothetical protein